MSTVITVENLGKKYTLHHQQREQYTALRDVIADGFKGVGRRVASVFHQSRVPSPRLRGGGGESLGGRYRVSSGIDGAGKHFSERRDFGDGSDGDTIAE